MKNLKAELDKEFPESMACLSAAENRQLNMMKKICIKNRQIGMQRMKEK